ncbi:MAG: sel1 repeat family protein, partial [Zymomonas sp.]|nr:sel1 repeat family protein [Zymomonas sp.]
FWYQQAANQGLVEAEFNLGIAYLKGQGVQKDKDKATFWLGKAADKGDSHAQDVLEMMNK